MDRIQKLSNPDCFGQNPLDLTHVFLAKFHESRSVDSKAKSGYVNNLQFATALSRHKKVKQAF
jgi:hypothetical protein